jgi:hypothetical protein
VKQEKSEKEKKRRKHKIKLFSFKPSHNHPLQEDEHKRDKK